MCCATSAVLPDALSLRCFDIKGWEASMADVRLSRLGSAPEQGRERMYARAHMQSVLGSCC